MAGDWIKVENTTPDKPEVHVMAEELGIDPDAVLGKLIRLWIWADEQTYNGNAGTVTLSLLDRVAGITEFGQSMLRAGWIQRSDHGLVFPNFDRHNGQSAKTRALTARRVRAHKVTQKQRSGNAASVTPSSLLLDPSSAQQKKKATQSRTAERSIAAPYSEAFETFWKCYPKIGRVGKQRGWRAWKAQVKLGKTEEEMIEAGRKYAASEKGRGKFAGHAASFLNANLDDDPACWDSAEPQRKSLFDD